MGLFSRRGVKRTPEQEALAPLLEELRVVVAEARDTQAGYSALLDRAERVVERTEKAVNGNGQ